MLNTRGNASLPHGGSNFNAQRKILRDAHARTLKDPELSAEAKQYGWEIKPVRGEQLEVIAKEVIDQPPDVIEWFKKLLEK
jgi:hypothetical protein